MTRRGQPSEGFPKGDHEGVTEGDHDGAMTKVECGLLERRFLSSSEELFEEIRQRLTWIEETREEFINLSRTPLVGN